MNASSNKSHSPDDETSQPAAAKVTAGLDPSGGVANVSSKRGTEVLPENIAGILCYLFGWVGGLVFLLFDRRPFVRFHAAQSVAVFATLNILLLALSGFLVGAIVPRSAAALLVLRRLVELTWLVATVILVLKAAGGEWFRVGKIASHYGDEAAHGMR